MTGKLLPTKMLLKEPLKTESKTASGIILPDAVVKTPTSMATAVLVGDGTAALPMIVKVGDRVLFSPHAVSRVAVPDEGEFLLLDIKDVLLIL